MIIKIESLNALNDMKVSAMVAIIVLVKDGIVDMIAPLGMPK